MVKWWVWTSITQIMAVWKVRSVSYSQPDVPISYADKVIYKSAQSAKQTVYRVLQITVLVKGDVLSVHGNSTLKNIISKIVVWSGLLPWEESMLLVVGNYLETYNPKWEGGHPYLLHLIDHVVICQSVMELSGARMSIHIIHKIKLPYTLWFTTWDKNLLKVYLNIQFMYLEVNLYKLETIPVEHP